MVQRAFGARLVGPLLAYLEAHDVDADALLARVGLDPRVARDPDGSLDAARGVRLWHEAERVMKDPLIGLSVGATVTRESFDLLSQATAVSATFREMGERLSRFMALAVTTPVYELRESGASAWWIVADVFPGAHCVRHLCELSVSLGVTYTRKFAGQVVSVRRVHFDHDAAAPIGAYEQILGAKVAFSQHEAGFEIDRALLDQPLPRADAGLARVLDRFAEERVGKLPAQGDLVARARVELSALLDAGLACDLSVLAKRLAISTRSLQRHLAASDHTFQQLLDAERHRAALRHVQQDGASLSQVSEQLGFSDVAAFRRAFKRWTGLSPRAYLARR